MPKNEIRQRLVQKLKEIGAELEQVDLRKADLELRHEKLCELMKSLDGLPLDLLSLVEGEVVEEDEDTPALTNFHRIAAYLRSENNQPKSLAELEKGTGVPRTSISAVIYRTHPQEFVSHDLPGARAKAWSLKPPEPDRRPEVPEPVSFLDDPPPMPIPATVSEDLPF